MPRDDKVDDCCTPAERPADPRIARHFDKAMRSHADAGKLPQMVAVSQRLLEMVADVADLRPTVLEIGSGSGALSIALLERGAASADGVDLSAESVATAKRRAEAAGVADRADFRLGDGSLTPLERHDWVVLDRVFCCYAHIDRLLANAVSAAGIRFIFSVPHSRGWRSLITRAISLVENATNTIRGRPCPGYVHDIGKIERHLAAAGFRPLRMATVGLWHAAVYERPVPA